MIIHNGSIDSQKTDYFLQRAKRPPPTTIKSKSEVVSNAATGNRLPKSTGLPVAGYQCVVVQHCNHWHKSINQCKLSCCNMTTKIGACKQGDKFRILSYRQRQTNTNMANSQAMRLLHLKCMQIVPLLLLLLLIGLINQIHCQCPWPKEQTDLHSDCICDFNPPYNHLNRISIQCSPVNISQLIEALSSSASVPIASALSQQLHLSSLQDDITYELSSSAKIDLLHINNSTISRLTNNMFLLMLGSNGDNNNIRGSTINNTNTAMTMHNNNNETERLRVIAIQSLHISRSAIETIDDGAFIGLEPHLISLSLQDNLLTVIPYKALNRLNNLKVLDLSNNHIMQIKSNAFFRLNHLNTLRLADNKFYQTGSISNQAFVGLERSLNDLNLKNTQLNLIPSSIRHLEKLAFLNLAQNQISQIPAKMFAHMRSLTAINLERNRISSIDDDTFFGVESTLSSLSLLGNLIERFPQKEITKLARIRRLDMGFNSMKSIPNDTFLRNTMLNLVALDGNPLETLPESAFKTLNSTLLFLSIGGRSLICDCRLSWILRWQHDYKLQVTSRDRQPQFCSKPQYLRSVASFATLTLDHLACSPPVQYKILEQHGNQFARKNTTNQISGILSQNTSDNVLDSSSLWHPSTISGGYNLLTALAQASSSALNSIGNLHSTGRGNYSQQLDLPTTPLITSTLFKNLSTTPNPTELNGIGPSEATDLMELGTTESRTYFTDNQTLSYDYPYLARTTPDTINTEGSIVIPVHIGLGEQNTNDVWSSQATRSRQPNGGDNMVTLPINTDADNQFTTSANNNQFGLRTTSATPPLFGDSGNPANDANNYVIGGGLLAPFMDTFDDSLFDNGNQPDSNSRKSNRHGYLHRHLSSGSNSLNSSLTYQHLLQNIQQADTVRRRTINNSNNNSYNSLIFGAKNSSSQNSNSSQQQASSFTVLPPTSTNGGFSQQLSGTTKGPRLVADNNGAQSHRYSISVSSSVSPASSGNQATATSTMQPSVTSSLISNFNPQRISSLINQKQQHHHLSAASSDIPTIVPSPSTLSTSIITTGSLSLNSRRLSAASNHNTTNLIVTPTPTPTTTTTATSSPVTTLKPITSAAPRQQDQTSANNTRMSVSSIYRLSSPIIAPNVTINGTYGNVRLLTPQRVAKPPYMSLGLPSLADKDNNSRHQQQQQSNQSNILPTVSTTEADSVAQTSPSNSESSSTTSSNDYKTNSLETSATPQAPQFTGSGSFEAIRTTPSLFFSQGNKRKTSSTPTQLPILTTTSNSQSIPNSSNDAMLTSADNGGNNSTRSTSKPSTTTSTTTTTTTNTPVSLSSTLSTSTTKYPRRPSISPTVIVTQLQDSIAPLGTVVASTLATEPNAIIPLDKSYTTTAIQSRNVSSASLDVSNLDNIQPRLHKQSNRHPSARADDSQIISQHSNSELTSSPSIAHRGQNSSQSLDSGHHHHPYGRANDSTDNDPSTNDNKLANQDVGQSHNDTSTTSTTSVPIIEATQQGDNQENNQQFDHDQANNNQHDQMDNNQDDNINLLASNTHLQTTSNGQGAYTNFTSGQFRFAFNRFGRLTDFDQMAVIIAGSLCLIIISIAMIFLCCCYKRWCLCCCLRMEKRCSSSSNSSSDNSSATLHGLSSKMATSKSMLLSTAIVESSTANRQRNLLASLSGTTLGMGTGHANEAYHHHQFVVDTLHKSGQNKHNTNGKYNSNSNSTKKKHNNNNASLSASSANTIEKRLTLSTTASSNMGANELYPLDHQNGIKNHKHALQLHQYNTNQQHQQYVYHGNNTLVNKQPNYRIDEDWINDDDGEGLSYCDSDKSSPRQHNQTVHYDNGGGVVGDGVPPISKCSINTSKLGNSSNNQSSGLLTTATSFSIPQADYYDSDRSATSSDRHLLTSNANDSSKHNGLFNQTLSRQYHVHDSRADNHHHHRGIHRSRSMAAIGAAGHDNMIMHDNYGIALETNYYKSGHQLSTAVNNSNNNNQHPYDYEHVDKLTRYNQRGGDNNNYKQSATRGNNHDQLDQLQTMTMNRRLFPPVLNGRSNFHPRGLILSDGGEHNEHLLANQQQSVAKANKQSSKRYSDLHHQQQHQQQYSDESEYYYNNNNSAGMPPPPLPQQLSSQQQSTTPAAGSTSSSFFSQVNGYMVPSSADSRHLQYGTAAIYGTGNTMSRMFASNRLGSGVVAASAATPNYNSQQQVIAQDMDGWSNDNQVDAMYVDNGQQQQATMSTTNNSTGKYYLQPASTTNGSAVGRQSGTSQAAHQQHRNRYHKS